MQRYQHSTLFYSVNRKFASSKYRALLIAKTQMWQKHQIHLANFDLTILRVIGFAPLLGCRHIAMIKADRSDTTAC
jgi:hypothetical protein